MTEIAQALQEISTRLTGIEKITHSQAVNLEGVVVQLKTINNRGCQRGDDMTKYFNTQSAKSNGENSESLRRVHKRIDDEAKDVTKRIDKTKDDITKRIDKFKYIGAFGGLIAGVLAYFGVKS